MTDIPSSMRAIEIASPGGPDVLRVVQRPVPRIRDGELLVRVTAAGVNRPDVMQRMGKYPPPPGASDIPGLEISGEIVAAASGGRFTPGDAVCALVAGGGYAEYCAVPEVQCLPVPEGVSLGHAAAIPETFFTVWTNLFQRAALARGETVLVHGGSSGIGTTAIQLAIAFGAKVFTTAGTDERCLACEQLGAMPINYKKEDFVAVVRQGTNGLGVDVILDIVGGDYLPRNIECLAMNGRLVQIGLIGGSRAAIDMRPILQKRLTLTGSTLRARTPAEKGAIARDLEAHVWPLFARGGIRAIVDAEFPLDQAAEAHRALEAGRIFGKAILIC